MAKHKSKKLRMTNSNGVSGGTQAKTNNSVNVTKIQSSHSGNQPGRQPQTNDYVNVTKIQSSHGGNQQGSVSNARSSQSDSQQGSQNQHDNTEEGTYECTVQDSNGIRRRGKTILAEVWNLPEGHRIVIEVNNQNQPIGDEGGVLGCFCGTIARNGNLCSLSHTRWDQLKKGCDNNNKKMILKEVEMRFIYPKSLEKWILKSIGHKWRDYKCLLKGKYYDDTTKITSLHNKCPTNVQSDQWISLVNFWRSDEGQKRSRISKQSLEKAKVKPISTTGTKSHARVREELRKTLNKSPTRTEVYLECHQHVKEVDVTNKIKSFAAEQGDKEVNLEDDPVSKVLGKDRYGRVRGFGLGVKPSDLGEPSYPSYCNGLNMSSKDEAAILYYLHKFKGEMQRLKKRVKKQGNTIVKLKMKLQSHYGVEFDDSDSDEYEESDSIDSDSNNPDSNDIESAEVSGTPNTHKDYDSSSLGPENDFE